MDNIKYAEPQEVEISGELMQKELNGLKELLLADGTTLNNRALLQLEQYTRLLLKWNTVINLTAITELPAIMTKHYYDSLAPLSILQIKQNASLIDVGTGAGFPSLPIKIIRGDIQVTLLDSLRKRLDFLEKVVKELSLNSVKTVHSRAEDAGANKLYREKYDYATARAVAPLGTLCEYCMPFVKVGGSFFAYKGLRAKEELSASKGAIRLLGGEVSQVIEIHLPDEEGTREVIEIKKISHTPTEFPRKTQAMTKKPL